MKLTMTSRQPIPMKITRPRTSYNFFFHEERKRLQEVILRETGKRPEYTQISKLVASKWKNILPSEKAYYKSLAAADKRRYGLELINLSTQGHEIEQITSTTAARYDQNCVNADANEDDAPIHHGGPGFVTETRETLHQYLFVNHGERCSMDMRLDPMQQQSGTSNLQESIENTLSSVYTANAEIWAASFSKLHDNQANEQATAAPQDQNLRGLLVQLLQQPGTAEMLASLLMQHPAVHPLPESIAPSALPQPQHQHDSADVAWIPREMFDDDIDETFSIHRS
mmetsp:Transcript_160/g.298  ORF Transcript_160/g.298 Transcript_160/m.298 type:complete len:283 (+) Transcript_160:185-1033(+)